MGEFCNTEKYGEEYVPSVSGGMPGKAFSRGLPVEQEGKMLVQHSQNNLTVETSLLRFVYES